MTNQSTSSTSNLDAKNIISEVNETISDFDRDSLKNFLDDYWWSRDFFDTLQMAAVNKIKELELAYKNIIWDDVFDQEFDDKFKDKIGELEKFINEEKTNDRNKRANSRQMYEIADKIITIKGELEKDIKELLNNLLNEKVDIDIESKLVGNNTFETFDNGNVSLNWQLVLKKNDDWSFSFWEWANPLRIDQIVEAWKFKPEDEIYLDYSDCKADTNIGKRIKKKIKNNFDEYKVKIVHWQDNNGHETYVIVDKNWNPTEQRGLVWEWVKIYTNKTKDRLIVENQEKYTDEIIKSNEFQSLNNKLKLDDNQQKFLVNLLEKKLSNLADSYLLWNVDLKDSQNPIKDSYSYNLLKVNAENISDFFLLWGVDNFWKEWNIYDKCLSYKQELVDYANTRWKVILNEKLKNNDKFLVYDGVFLPVNLWNKKNVELFKNSISVLFNNIKRQLPNWFKNNVIENLKKRDPFYKTSNDDKWFGFGIYYRWLDESIYKEININLNSNELVFPNLVNNDFKLRQMFYSNKEKFVKFLNEIWKKKLEEWYPDDADSTSS